MIMKKAYLVLADGRIFNGLSFGYESETFGEVVFNTSITGYQEILTDPSYCGQIVTMTYPHIGNYGVNPEDVESERPHVAGFIVRAYSEIYSNWRARSSLGDYLKANKIVAGTGFDTRAIVRHIRDKGAMPALLIIADTLPEDAVQRAGTLPSMAGQDLASKVTCRQMWEACHPERAPTSVGTTEGSPRKNLFRKFFEMRNAKCELRVVLYDFGAKRNIIRMLQERGCNVTIVPAATPAKEVLSMKPDGVMLSNGPGDPAAVTYAIENIRNLLGKAPIFGICLGHQLLSLALGAKTYKLKFGHRGANQPVKNLETGRVEITSQNHGFAVDASSLEQLEPLKRLERVQITHINLNDNTVEGIEAPKLKAFSVQYHPEASPGPHDASYLFDKFIEMM